jgi:calreticulin
MCGPSNRRIHLIFNYKGNNLLWKKSPPCKTDQLTHLYTLILRPDNTYEVRVDQEKVESGDLETDWDFLKPKMIKDPAQSKPADWVDEAKIDDPNDSKPADWDVPETIPDAKATKPDDWDEDDGEWTAPLVPNPAFKGTWRPKQIDNPAYKGPWVHPEIANPEYQADPELYVRGAIEYAAFELWQVTAGTIFDNILVTSDEAEAKAHADKHFKAHKDAEEKAFREHEDKKNEEERKKAEEERKKADEAKASSKKDDDDDDDDKKEEL